MFGEYRDPGNGLLTNMEDELDEHRTYIKDSILRLKTELADVERALEDMKGIKSGTRMPQEFEELLGCLCNTDEYSLMMNDGPSDWYNEVAKLARIMQQEV